MAKSVNFTIMKKEAAKKKPFFFDVPARYAKSGKRERWYYAKRAEAESARLALLDKVRKYGEAAKGDFSPTEAKMLSECLEMLMPTGASLSEAVTDYVTRWKAANNQVTVAHAAELYLGWVIGSKRSVKYVGDVRRMLEKFKIVYGEHNFSDLARGEIITWMEQNFTTPGNYDWAIRTLRPFGSYAVQREWAVKNVFEGILSRSRSGQETEISVLSPEQASSMLEACRDLRPELTSMNYIYSVDCSDCSPAVALLLFGGVRPKELERLTWEDIHWERGMIRVGAAKSKTGALRNLEINDTLHAWLCLVPEEQRKGAIVPSNWKRKIQSIRKVCGLGELQDACRHSYASYWLAIHDDPHRLRANLGQNSREVLFRHYATAVFKDDAKRYWALLPVN